MSVLYVGLDRHRRCRNRWHCGDGRVCHSNCDAHFESNVSTCILWNPCSFSGIRKALHKLTACCFEMSDFTHDVEFIAVSNLF
jgi:hypothetical protein